VCWTTRTLFKLLEVPDAPLPLPTSLRHTIHTHTKCAASERKPESGHITHATHDTKQFIRFHATKLLRAAVSRFIRDCVNSILRWWRKMLQYTRRDIITCFWNVWVRDALTSQHHACEVVSRIRRSVSVCNSARDACFLNTHHDRPEAKSRLLLYSLT